MRRRRACPYKIGGGIQGGETMAMLFAIATVVAAALLVALLWREIGGIRDEFFQKARSRLLQRLGIVATAASIAAAGVIALDRLVEVGAHEEPGVVARRADVQVGGDTDALELGDRDDDHLVGRVPPLAGGAPSASSAAITPPL